MRPVIKICALPEGNSLEPPHNIQHPVLISVPGNHCGAWTELVDNIRVLHQESILYILRDFNWKMLNVLNVWALKNISSGNLIKQFMVVADSLVI